MIIDTNVYSALDRGKPSAVASIQSSMSIQVPFCVIGELRFGFMLGKNRQENNKRLDKFLSMGTVEILMPSLATTDIYGEISAYCRHHGRSLSNNDLWIASLAIETNLKLITYDRDFLVLSDRMGDKLLILDD